MTDKEPKRPDSEVLKTKPRRRFTAKYKLGILAELDACIKPGEIGALLRKKICIIQIPPMSKFVQDWLKRDQVNNFLS